MVSPALFNLRISEVFEQIGNAQYLSRFDLTKGYYQVPLSDDTKEKSAFVTPFGLYEFNVMPFGMKTSPATFIRLITASRFATGIRYGFCH
jgi:hypothetical protein